MYNTIRLGLDFARQVRSPTGTNLFAQARTTLNNFSTHTRTKRGCRAGLKVQARRLKEHSIPTIIRARSESGFVQTRTPNLDLLVPVQRKPNGTTFPKIFLSNARSMVNKLEDIYGSITSNLCEIAVITESWLSSRVTDDLINMPGFVTCRRDRARDQRGGGLCTYISTRMDFVELSELCDPELECQWFLIKPNRLPRGINSIILGTVYHPPQNDDNKLRAHLFSSLDKGLAAHPNSAIILVGDVNQFKPGNLCSSYKLRKLVTKPTRGNNILDQAFSTLSSYYEEAQILPPVGLSDHSSVFLQPASVHSTYVPTERVNKRLCREPNKRDLFSAIQTVSWTPLYRLPTCSEQLEKFQTTITSAMDVHVPVRQVKLHPRDKPWFTQEIKEAIANRQRA